MIIDNYELNYRRLTDKQSNTRRLSKKQLLYGTAALLIVLCIGTWFSLFLPFPELDAFRQRDWSTRVYDRSGNLIQILALEDGIRREFTAYESMPPDAVRIFLAAEDKDFFSHRGIDVAAIARAAYQNISSGKRVSGASTITMQLARLIVPAKDVLTEWANTSLVMYSSWESLLESNEVQMFFREEIERRVNEKTGFRTCERINRFVLLPNSFETGKEVNAKGEMMRYKITKIYAKEIKSLFA